MKNALALTERKNTHRTPPLPPPPSPSPVPPAHGEEQERFDCTRLAALPARLDLGLRTAAPDAVIFGASAARVPGITCLARPGRAAETQIIALDLAGIAVSAGAACSSGKSRTSPVLAAMGVAPALAGCAIRVSLGWGSGEGDVERVLAALSPAAAHRP